MLIQLENVAELYYWRHYCYFWSTSCTLLYNV